MESFLGYFHDDGTPLNPNLIAKPHLCLSCIHNEDKTQEILCNLTRLDQMNEKEFNCYSYLNNNQK